MWEWVSSVSLSLTQIAVAWRLNVRGLVTSVIHRLVSPVSSSSTGQGLTIGIDHLPGLVDLSRKNITSDRITLGLKEARSPSSEGEGEDKGKRSAGGVEVVLGDGRQGWEEYGKHLRTRFDTALKLLADVEDCVSSRQHRMTPSTSAQPPLLSLKL